VNGDGPPPVRVLTVCTHNRTRSVMMEAMLGEMLGERLGAGAVDVRSSGFRTAGLPAIDEAIAAMDRRGLDIGDHRSRVTSVQLVDGADLIVTAERDHVVRIATLSSTAFRRAMTLPELLERAATGGGDASDLRAWSEMLTEDRRAGDYLRRHVPEVADPTGAAPRAFEEAVVELERQCLELAVLISVVAAR
jgi:protein-tyrosine phosphatase